jgi:hypothetical protein
LASGSSGRILDGLAAAGGLLMNLAFLLAGTTSTNPVLAVLGVLLILAWSARRSPKAAPRASRSGE